MMTDAKRLTAEERATILAESFHVLVGVPGVRPFDSVRLKRWTRTGAATNASREAAKFVLNVYNSANPPCNLAYAIAIWDGDMRAAFQAWAANPFTL